MAICKNCDLEYSICYTCGVSHYIGSSGAEHYMSCTMGLGLFEPNDGDFFPSWEAPNGECPSCWHKSNPDKEKVETQEWLMTELTRFFF